MKYQAKAYNPYQQEVSSWWLFRAHVAEVLPDPLLLQVIFNVAQLQIPSHVASSGIPAGSHG